MTNEQKARELAHFILYDNSYESMDRNTYDKCMEMAKWKDNKFYLILACIKVSLEKAGLSGDKFIDEIKKQWEE